MSQPRLSRTKRIRAILQTRRKPVARLSALARHLDAARQELAALDDVRQRLLVDPATPDAIRERLSGLPFADAARRLVEASARVGRLEAKFSRDTLNIGVVGQAGQGKSSLLKAITGLGEEEIPTSNTNHCTGVSARFVNRPGEVFAEVSFHTGPSVVADVLAPYFSTAEDGLGLGTAPSDLDTFRTRPLPPLPPEKVGRSVEETAYGHLREYHQNVERFKGQLTGVQRHRIGRDEIRRYTAQITADGRKLTDWMAVRDAHVYCPFPAADVGPVTLLDTPGLGDTRPGEMARTFRVLQEHVDFVLFVRKPDATAARGWGQLDLKLYDRAAQALAPLPLTRCSMMVLNRTFPGRPGDNKDQCDQFVASLGEKNLRFQHHTITDCADPERARTDVLDWIVDYLSDHIEALDGIHLDAIRQEMAELQAVLGHALALAESALGEASGRGDETKTFLPLFRAFWTDLTWRLEGLVKTLLTDRDKNDERLKVAVVEARKRADEQPLPSEREVEERQAARGGYPQAYGDLLNEYRASLSQHFYGLDEGLKARIALMFDQVADAIAGTKLGIFAPERGESFLRRLRDETGLHSAKLAAALDSLLSFRLTYRGLIQHRISVHLDELRPNRNKRPLPPNPNARQVAGGVAVAIQQVLYHVGTSLDDILVEPNQATYAVVEEFVDTVLRAKGVEDEWFYLLDALRADVWAAEFDAFGERSRRRQEWVSAIGQARTAVVQLAVDA